MFQKCSAKAVVVLFLVLISIVDIAFAQGSREVAKAARPDWVSHVAIPEATEQREAQVTSGVYYLLASRQVRQHGSERHLYLRFARKIINRTGMESAGTISVNFRPDIDNLTFHDIRIHRNGVVIDLMNSTGFSVFQRETELEKGILDGRLTAFTNLPAVKIGDIIEYAVSVRYRPILMGNDIFAEFQHSYLEPVGLLESRVIVPEGLDIKIKDSSGENQPIITRNNGEVAHTWLSRDTDPTEKEENVPLWVDPFRTIQISSAGSWHDVITDSLDHYPPVESLPAAFEAKLNKIRGEAGNPMAAMTRALALVQQDIRYVGVELGRGAFIPRPPKTVLERGYGDCKDKSYLLVEALRRLGIEAYPALVHLEKGHSLLNSLPSPYAFDHVIVQALVGDEVYWLDPTLTHQRSPDPKYSTPDYGFALPVSKKAIGLEPIKPLIPAEPLTRIVEDISLNYDNEKPVMALRVRTTYQGADADEFRRNVESKGISELVRTYLEYYQNLYPGISQSKEISIEKNLATNTITVEENYAVREAEKRKKLFETLYLQGDSTRNKLVKIAEKERRHPVSITFPFYHEHQVNIRNLDGAYTPLDPVTIDKPYLKFSLVSKAGKDDLSVTWQLKTKRNQVLPEEANDYRVIVDEIEDKTSWYYDVRASTGKPGTRSDEGFEEFAGKDTFFLVIFGMSFGLAILGCWWGMKADADYRRLAHYFPVSTVKIALMTIITLGLYSFFWFWKHWRWSKSNSNSDVQPFLRAMFWPLFIYPAINEINSKLPMSDRMPVPLMSAAVVSAALWCLLSIYTISLLPVTEPVYFRVIIDFVTEIFGLIALLIVAGAVAKLNGSNFRALRQNSRINNLNLAGIVLFPFLVYLTYF